MTVNFGEAFTESAVQESKSKSCMGYCYITSKILQNFGCDITVGEFRLAQSEREAYAAKRKKSKKLYFQLQRGFDL